MNIRDISITWKMTWICVILLVIPVVSLGFLHYTSSEKELYRLIERQLQEETILIAKQVETAMSITQQQINTDLQVAHEILFSSGEPRLNENERITLNVTEQVSQQRHSVTIPVMTLDGQKAVSHNEIVDRIQQLVGGTATIFQAIPDGLLRLSTNVLTSEGERAVNTYIGSDSPVYQTIMHGETYYGRAYVVHDWYQTAYEPIRDTNGTIIGALYVGVKDASHDILNSLKDIVIGKSGYIWILNLEGEYVLSRQRERDGENILESRDENGHFFVKEWVANAPTLEHGESIITTYDWQNSHDETIRKKLAAYTYFPEWEWIIGTSAYVDDFTETLTNIRNLTIIVSFLVIAIGSGLAYFLALLIVNPLRKSIAFARSVTNGDLSADFTITHKDEIGILADAFMQMRDKIQAVLQEMNRLVQAVQAGKLDERGDAARFQGGWQELVSGFNRVIDAFVEPISTTARHIDLIANGTLPEPITTKYQGDFDEMRLNVNTLTSNLKDMLQELDELLQAVQNGILEIRGDHDQFIGDWRRLVVGINNVIDAFVEPITMASESIDRIARGDLPDTIQERYKGDFNAITRDLNTLITSMRGITRLAEEMADGNMDIQVHERSEGDDLMKALNTMIHRLQSIVLTVKTAADHVAADSLDMSHSAESVSQSASEQAATAEEVASSMEQMATVIKQNAQNASETEEIALKSAEDTHEAEKAVLQAAAAMQKIAKKITVIEEISRQTTMLSLNATIEAAKAKDSGKGFKVVASEVRALAKRSQAAAEEINYLTASSLAISERAGMLLKNLTPDIQKTASLVQEISRASHEQSIGVEQINKAIQQLDQVIQQNAATSVDMASTAGQLANQAEELQQVITFFKSQEHQPSGRDERGEP